MISYKKGNIVKGKVSGITEYGIFVKLENNYNGLIHISEISSQFVKDPNEFAKINDMIDVEILEVDDEKEQVRLSIKNLNSEKKTKKMIKETPHGFKTLAYMLPFWINDSLKREKTDKLC